MRDEADADTNRHFHHCSRRMTTAPSKDFQSAVDRRYFEPRLIADAAFISRERARSTQQSSLMISAEISGAASLAWQAYSCIGRRLITYRHFLP